MSDLNKQQCQACQVGAPRVTKQQKQELRPQIPDWELVEEAGVEQLRRVYSFDNFVAALAFTNKVGELAEQQDHHPALLTEWGRTTVTWWTHKIKGLHINDFIMAAKSDELFKNCQG